MVPFSSLLLPILVSGVAVFIVSSIIHMMLPYHRSDMKALPQEDRVLEALRGLNIPPGDYGAPHPGSMAGMRSPEFAEKVKRGPLVLINVAAGGSVGMGKQLGLWFVYSLIVGLLCADLAHDALVPGSSVEEVCFFVGTAAFMGYGLALLQFSIWYRRSWITTFKSLFDSIIYAIVTGQVFG